MFDLIWIGNMLVPRGEAYLVMLVGAVLLATLLATLLVTLSRVCK